MIFAYKTRNFKRNNISPVFFVTFSKYSTVKRLPFKCSGSLFKAPDIKKAMTGPMPATLNTKPENIINIVKL